jgi:hypothetical protein
LWNIMRTDGNILGTWWEQGKNHPSHLFSDYKKRWSQLGGFYLVFSLFYVEESASLADLAGGWLSAAFPVIFKTGHWLLTPKMRPMRADSGRRAQPGLTQGMVTWQNPPRAAYPLLRFPRLICQVGFQYWQSGAKSTRISNLDLNRQEGYIW